MLLQTSENERVGTSGQPCSAEYQDRQRHSAAHLQLPERKIADGDAGRIFQRAPHGIEQAPRSADCALELLLPQFIIGLEQVDAEILALGKIEDLRDRPGLID